MAVGWLSDRLARQIEFAWVGSSIKRLKSLQLLETLMHENG
jgi:hypothetical protein